MYNGILHAHSGLRWIALILILIAIIKAISSKNKPYAAIEKKLGLFTLMSFHTQVLLGLYLYMSNSAGKINFSEGFMGETIYRFYGIEHITGMLIAATLITVGYSRSKKKTEPNAKRKQYTIWFSVALVIVLASIPWPFREALGGHWF